LLVAPQVRGVAETASAPVESIDSEYLVETWQTERGLPDNYVNAIAQTPEGYLWVATFNGLARFNGVEFIVFDAANTPELPTSRIVGLHCDRKGRLWIFSEYGDLTQWADGRFKSFGEREGMPKHVGGVMWEDHEGGIWVAGSYDDTNYFQLVNGTFTRDRASNTMFERFGRAPDAQGYGWGIRDTHLFSVHGQYDVTIPHFTTSEGWRLIAAVDGGMWLIANRIQKFHPLGEAGQSASNAHAAGHFEDFGPIPVATDQFGGYLADRNGNLWVGTGVGELWRIGTNHTFRRFKFPNSTTLELGRSLFEDAEGNIWIGNGGDGLVRIRPRALKTFDSRDGLASDVVRSVSQDGEGNVWLATVNRVDWFPHGNSSRAEPRGVEMHLPWNTYGARDGAMWIGTLGEGVLRVSGKSQTWVKD
jgi:ligand-binding sensor domain-containing protein